MLQIALSHQHDGRSVIAVKKDKRPYHQGWNSYFSHKQTEDEVQKEFANGTDGIALILYPSCEFVVLDFDGPHAEAAWASTGIALPEVARVTTRSGGKHLYFRIPTTGLFPNAKRNIKIVKASCGCDKTCGVDLLINGYALIPPSPGYKTETDDLFATATELPAEVIALAQRSQKIETKFTGDKQTGRVSHGERKTIAISLAGTMRTRGMSIDAIASAIRADSNARFDPPLEEEEIQDILKSVRKWEVTRIGFHRLDDIGNGDRFADQHRTEIIWSDELGWRYFNGRCWQDNRTRYVERRAEETARSIYIEASQAKDQNTADEIQKWAHNSGLMRHVKAMLESAKNKDGMTVLAENFDRDHWLLNLKNGTLNLRTFELQPHKKDDFITKIINVDYDPNAQCRLWQSFLDRVVPNIDTQRFLRKAAGYSLTGSIDEQCFFLLYGTGKNGKSKFLETIAALLGDYAGVMRPEALMLQKYTSNAGDVADLRGLRFVYSVEPPPSETLNTSFIKQQTGGEELKGKFLYHNFFSFKPTHKLWIGANHDIRIKESDEGIRRRVRQIPFKIVIPENERDYQLGEKLLSELPGILNWAVYGLKLMLKEGLGMPAEVKEATDAYFNRVNPLKDFFDEFCVMDEKYWTGAPDIHRSYLDWAKNAGEKNPIKRRRFAELMTELGFIRKTIHGKDYWYGIALKTDQTSMGD